MAKLQQTDPGEILLSFPGGDLDLSTDLESKLVAFAHDVRQAVERHLGEQPFAVTATHARLLAALERNGVPTRGLGGLDVARRFGGDDLSWCQAVVFDFDGVLTDNAVYVNQQGLEAVRCDRSDGLGFGLARQAGLKTFILSKETNPVVKARAAKLGVDVLHGIDDKPTVLSHWLAENGLTWADIIYVGNDLNDLGCMQQARLGVAVADAVPQVLAAADCVLERPGGHGAARELLDLVLASRSPTAKS